MKQIILIALCLIALTSPAHDKKYEEAMTRQIQIVYTSEKTEELQAAVNSLDRISQAEKDKWEPLYYAAFGYVMLANQETGASKKDAHLDQALKRLDQASLLSKDNSEITALEGFVHMIRVTIDPNTRGQQYSGLSMQAFGKALQQNPGNPRAMALMAQMQYGMAQFFNSPTTEACGLAQKALAQFNSGKTEGVLSPAWGKGMTEDMLKRCQ